MALTPCDEQGLKQESIQSWKKCLSPMSQFVMYTYVAFPSSSKRASRKWKAPSSHVHDHTNKYINEGTKCCKQNCNKL